MACFIVPAAEALAVSCISKIIEKKEKQPETVMVAFEGGEPEAAFKLFFSQKLKWLSRLEWGGTALLAFEHLWHGELIAKFPFLTAINDGGTMGMLKEMATVGVGMALLATGVWIGMLGISKWMEKRAVKQAALCSNAKQVV